MKFFLKNPNKSLISYGFILLAINLFLIYSPEFIFTTGSNPKMLVIGLGIIIKLLVLVWIPKAASLVGRHSLGWTILCFLLPSFGFILLGSLGYKKTPEIIKLTEDCIKSIENKKDELVELKQKGALDDIQYTKKLNEYIKDINDFASEQVNKIYDNEYNAFLTKELERKGFVMSKDSEVFVDVDEHCPACGAKINEKDKSCPACNLVFEHED